PVAGPDHAVPRAQARLAPDRRLTAPEDVRSRLDNLEPMPHVVILAGPSGSGKSHLAERLGWTVLRLDDFYHSIDHPDLPRSTLGIPDWDDVGSWNRRAAVETIRTLCRKGRAEVPVYDIATSRPTGTHEVALDGDRFIAEGLFAAEIVEDCRRAGLLDAAFCLT